MNDRRRRTPTDLKAALASVLGLDDPTEDQVVAAVESLTTPADAVPAMAVPEGAVLVDEGVLAELRRKAEDGVAALAQIDATRRDHAIVTAQTEGRISAATAPVWRERMDADEEGTTALLATLPANTIPVQEIGHSGDETETGPSLTEIWAEKGA